MKYTREEGAVFVLLLIGALCLCGLYLVRSLQTEKALQLPEPVSAPAAVVEPDTASGRLDLNTAAEEELEARPGIGPALAERIVAYRTENGPYLSVEELLLVRGIGEKILQKLEAYVTVGETVNQYQEVNK